jgi:hypothetical protein
MVTISQQLVAQTCVLWHQGCAGGSAWVQWGLTAIEQYRKSGGTEARLVAEMAERFWDTKEVRATRLLAQESVAGRELLRASLHYLWVYSAATGGAKSETSDAAIEKLLPTACSWAVYIATLVEGLYELPHDVLGWIRDCASERFYILPERIRLDSTDDLINAARVKLGLQRDIDSGSWPRIRGKDLSTDDARYAAEALLRIAATPGSRAGRDIAFKGLAYDFNRAALDGLELELGEINIVHSPAPGSPKRGQIRDHMLDVINEYLSIDHPSPRMKNRAKTAAWTLAGIGDERAIDAIVGYLSDQPARTAWLFNDQLFESLAYELTPRGKRRDLLLGFEIPLFPADMPQTPNRLDSIEIFRPVGGKCQQCGERMLALFDLLINPDVPVPFPKARRAFLPMCPKCCEQPGGYTSRVRLDDRESADQDAWPAEEASAPGQHSVPSRQFRVTQSEVGRSRMSARFGGTPKWEQYPDWPKCDSCRRRMLFAGQVTASHSYYGFFCPECLTSNVRTQYD